MIGCVSKPAGYTIKVYCDFCNGSYARLIKGDADSIRVVDSALIHNGKCKFVGSVKSPQMYFLFVDGAPDYLPVFLENTLFEIKFNFKDPERSVVEGGSAQDIFVDFMQTYSAYGDKISVLEKSRANALANGDSDMLPDLDSSLKAVETEKLNFQIGYYQKNINTPMADYILNQHLKYEVDINPDNSRLRK